MRSFPHLVFNYAVVLTDLFTNSFALGILSITVSVKTDVSSDLQTSDKIAFKCCGARASVED
jgi:hypothetical protein